MCADSEQDSRPARQQFPLPIDRRLRRRLGRAVYLLMLLTGSSDADGVVQSGRSVNAEELAADLGVGIRQARRDLQRLRHLGFLQIENTGRGFKIRVVGRAAM